MSLSNGCVEFFELKNMYFRLIAVAGTRQFTNAFRTLLLNVRWNGNIWVDVGTNREHTGIPWCTNSPQGEQLYFGSKSI